MLGCKRALVSNQRRPGTYAMLRALIWRRRTCCRLQREWKGGERRQTQVELRRSRCVKANNCVGTHPHSDGSLFVSTSGKGSGVNSAAVTYPRHYISLHDL